MGVKEASPEKLRSQAWKKLEFLCFTRGTSRCKGPERACFRQRAGAPGWEGGYGCSREAGPGGWGRRGLEAEIDELAVIRVFCLLGGSLGVCPRS